MLRKGRWRLGSTQPNIARNSTGGARTKRRRELKLLHTVRPATAMNSGRLKELELVMAAGRR